MSFPDSFDGTQRFTRGTPAVDGAINPAEGWTILTDGWGFSNTSLVADNNSFQSQVTIYAAWDPNCCT